MGHPHGMPIWYELITADPDAAEAFYGAVLGWTFSRPPGGLSRGYRVGSAADVPVAGILPRPEGAAIADSWFVYFAVEDPDATIDALEKKGGSVHMPATEIPGVGRIALVSDPQGIPFYVMRGEGDGGSRSFMPGGQALVGHSVWNELTTSDPAAAIAFYGAILGIRQEGAMPMGALGDYQFLHAGDSGIGAVMAEGPSGRKAWQVYFLVSEIGAAVNRLAEAGGKILQGPDEIPGGAFSVVAEDAGGIRFGMVGHRAG